MPGHGPTFCFCKIENVKIVHCALHARAESLVGVCEHIYELLRKLEVVQDADRIKIQEIILPYIEDSINRAMSEQKDGFGGPYRVWPPTSENKKTE